MFIFGCWARARFSGISFASIQRVSEFEKPVLVQLTEKQRLRMPNQLGFNSQCDQICQCLKVLDRQILSQILDDFSGYLENITFSLKTTVVTFLGYILKKIGLLFIPTSGHTGLCLARVF